MTVPRCATTRLTKRFGRVDSAAGPRPRDRAGRGCRLPRAERRGERHDDPAVPGMLRPTSGQAEIFGMDAHRATVAAHRRIAYVPGEASLWPSLTGAETLDCSAACTVRWTTRIDACSSTGSTSTRSRKVRAYSRGNRQKVVLIAALMTRADLLVLDEPTSGLDPLMEQAFRHASPRPATAARRCCCPRQVLSEVEATCDRVGILRPGGWSSRARSPSFATWRAQRRGHVRRGVPDLSGVPVVGSVDVRGRVLRCQVSARRAAAPALAGTGVQRLFRREPSLEEVFLAHYGARQAASWPCPLTPSRSGRALRRPQLAVGLTARRQQPGRPCRSGAPIFALVHRASPLGLRPHVPDQAERARWPDLRRQPWVSLVLGPAHASTPSAASPPGAASACSARRRRRLGSAGGDPAAAWGGGGGVGSCCSPGRRPVRSACGRAGARRTRRRAWWCCGRSLP